MSTKCSKITLAYIGKRKPVGVLHVISLSDNNGLVISRCYCAERFGSPISGLRETGKQANRKFKLMYVI